MATRGIRRKKSTLTEVKVAVIGAPSVGKSALTVRFLTKRYIGEYDHQTGESRFQYLYPVRMYFPDIDNECLKDKSRYRHEILVDNEPILVEIMDIGPKSIEELAASDLAGWADCLFLVYSITDRESFNYVKRVKQVLGQPDIPLALVGNKADMVHLRQVSLDEGEILAKDFECNFAEVAAAEQVGPVGDVFLDLCREVLLQRRRNKHSLLDRMLGNKTSHRAYSRGKSDSALPKE